MNTELFIARRMRTGGQSKGVMERIAVATTAIAIAVMIVAVAVIMGFRGEISSKIAAFTGHIRLQALDYSGTAESAPIVLSEGLRGDLAAVPGVRSVAAYSLKMGLMKTDEATAGVVLKGVDGDYDLGFFAGCLLEGTLPRVAGTVRHKDLLISEGVARSLRLGVDSRVEMLFVRDDRPPRRDRFRVCGIYSSGMGEMDDRFAITDRASVGRLGGWDDDQATGYEIMLDDFSLLDAAEQAVISAALPHDTGEPPLMVRTVTGDYPQLFDWLATHDVNAAVIVTIMIVVALVSMISALLIILLERIRMIGILKTLGMTTAALRRVFVMRSARIVLLGLAVGNVAGIGVAVAQARIGFLKLDAAGYFLSRVPVELGWWWIVALNAGTLVVLVALMVFPTSIVGGITPEKTIRYQ